MQLNSGGCSVVAKRSDQRCTTIKPPLSSTHLLVSPFHRFTCSRASCSLQGSCSVHVATIMLQYLDHLEAAEQRKPTKTAVPRENMLSHFS